MAKYRDRSAGRKNIILRNFRTYGSCGFSGQSSAREVVEHTHAAGEAYPSKKHKNGVVTNTFILEKTQDRNTLHIVFYSTTLARSSGNFAYR